MTEPFIPMRKKLRHDGRVITQAAALHQALERRLAGLITRVLEGRKQQDPALAAELGREILASLPLGFFKAAVIGGLMQLWCLGDEHGDVLPLSPTLLDMELGIPDFSATCCSEWLQSVTKNKVGATSAVRLPNYRRRNASTEKTRALVRERVRRHRNKRNAVTDTVTALPVSADQTRPDQTTPTNTRREDINHHQPTAEDRRAIVAYTREVLGLDMTRVVVVEEVLLDFGLAGVVEVVEHLASRKPSERFKGITNLPGFFKSLLSKAEDGPLPREHDFESFANWRARADARLASRGIK